MADLRDQLLKAGLIDKKAKQTADTDARRKKKKKKKKKKKGGGPSPEAERQAAWEAQKLAEAEANREREAARQRERERQEHQNRVSNLVKSAALRDVKEGGRRFCYVTREQRVRWIYVTAEVAWKLELGALAIVEQPGEPDETPMLVPRAAAERLRALQPDVVRFWNRD